MSTQSEITRRSHGRAITFFWCLLIGATLISLLGNVAHAALAYIPQVTIQIGAAAVPPIVLLAAVHGIGLAVRAGASGKVYRWAVGAVALIGVGAFSVSFLALRDLMHAIGYGSATAWIFPAIIDTAVAVSTMMLVALGDRPLRRIRTGGLAPSAESPRPTHRRAITAMGAKSQASLAVPKTQPATRAQGAVHNDSALADADLASELIATGATTQPMETVIAVLTAHRGGASINSAAKLSCINYRTAQRIVAAAAERQQDELLAAG